jgi:hypothetical protein
MSPHAQRKENTGATEFVASPHFVRWTTSMNRDFLRPEPAFGVDTGMSCWRELSHSDKKMLDLFIIMDYL